MSGKICFAAEVGLGGEIRAVNRIENRIAEAEKLGFSSICVSKYATKGADLNQFKIKVIALARLGEVAEWLFS